MKYGKKQTIGENLLYGMVWLAILLVPVLNSQMMSELHVSLENVLIAWRKIAPYLIIFLVHNAFIAPLMLRHRYAAYLLANLALIVSVFTVVELYERHIAEGITAELARMDGLVEHRRATFTDLEMYWNVILGIFMTGANLSIKLMYQSLRDEQRIEALKRQNLQAEMDYLKYQLNPHFFMNTLNNIHALIDINTESAKDAVIDLSKMMRYVLYESGSEIISLDRDIQFIRNYIELMRIRYAHAIELTLDAPQSLPGKVSIPPLLLIVFVENAFKHGVSNHRPSFIRIGIAYREPCVECTIVNSRHPGKRAGKQAGIGLENVRKRLDLIYGPKGYTLDIDESNPASYSVHLSIPTIHA